MNWIIESSSTLRGVDFHARRQIDLASRVDARRAGAGHESHSEFSAAGVTEAMMRCVRDLGVSLETAG